LTEIAGIPRDLLDGKHHQCPRLCIGGKSRIPGGKDRFRLIDEQEGAVLCSVCFHEKNGDGFAAIEWMRSCTFPQALSLVATSVGVKKKTRQKKTPAEALKFEKWRADRADWCESKGLDQETVIAAGGRMAGWKSCGVISIPILGMTAESKPRGFVIVNRRGGTLPSRSGEKKILVTEGSTTGWIGKDSLARLPGCKVVWKVEGVTDQLALSQTIPGDQRAAHAVLTNPFGSTENPKRQLLEVFKGKLAVIIHDPDDAGEKGSKKWAAAIAEIADQTHVVRLPGGCDLREWLAAGGTFNQLRSFARGSEIVTRAASKESDQPGESDEAEEVEEEDDDHIRLAKLFIRQRAKRFLIQDGCPHTWRGNAWHRAQSLGDLRSTALRFIVQEFDRLAIEKVEASKKKDEELPKRKRINAQLLGSVLVMIKSLASISAEIEYGSMLQREEDGSVGDARRRQLISFENGLLDLDDLLENDSKVELKSHTPDWWSLVHVPYEYDPEAKIGPYWTSFLSMNLGDDEKLIRCLQEWMGYCLLPNSDHQKFLIMIGEGNNGKSVFCAVLEGLLGEQNVSHVPLELFGQRFTLASTLGKLANIASETHDLDKVAEGYLKQFTDGSKMNFDRKGIPAIEARPTAKLIISTNQPPRFTDKSMGLWRRMLVAPFLVEIREDQKLLGLDKPDWWLDQGELPGVFNWAVEGLRRLQEAKTFTVTEVSEERKESLRRDNSPAREFVCEEYRLSYGDWVDKDAVYKAYKAFCETNGYRPMGARTFAKEFVRAVPGAVSARRGPRGNQMAVFLNASEQIRYSTFEPISGENDSVTATE
jgi:P4 family phage/plasmid primase-like protien